MSELLLLTNAADPPGEILPAISLLLHTVRTAPADATALADSPVADAVLVDARRDLVWARELCRLLRDMGVEIPLLAVLTEGVEDVSTPDRRKIYFLRRLPADPMYVGEAVDPAATWGLRSYASPPDAPAAGDDVFDVYSTSTGTGLNDVPYKDW